MQIPCKSLESQFVISGLQVQLLSPAPRKILRYTVEITVCIVGFLLLYALQIYQNVPCLCLIAQKMPCRSALQRALCWMPGGVDGAVQAAKFAGGLSVAAAGHGNRLETT